MRVILILVGVTIALSANAATPAESFYKSYLPDGVRLGMSPEQLRTQRPNAVDSPAFIRASAGANSSSEMVELPTHGQNPVAYWYRFKDGKLGAITRSLVIRSVPEQRIEAEVSKELTDIKGSFDQKGDEKILRSTNGTNTLLTARLWENKTAGEQAYLVASSSEITLVIFNPKLFGREHFFVGQEKLKDFEARSKELRESSKLSPEPTPTDLLQKIAPSSAQ